MLINTIYGEMEESLLSKLDGVVDNDNEYTTWVEYRIGDKIVHRSAHVTLKRMPEFASAREGSVL